EGFNLWDEMYKKYVDGGGNSLLRTEPDSDPNVSPESNSKYLRPYQIVSSNNIYYNGYNFTKAHYLEPIAFHHFQLTSEGGDPSNSVIYQNPFWPTAAGGTPTSD